jgi:hypothetical protein
VPTGSRSAHPGERAYADVGRDRLALACELIRRSDRPDLVRELLRFARRGRDFGVMLEVRAKDLALILLLG